MFNAATAQYTADHSAAATAATAAGTAHTLAASQHTAAASAHTTAGTDHSTAGTDHTNAASNHTRAQADWLVNAGDGTEAGRPLDADPDYSGVTQGAPPPGP